MMQQTLRRVASKASNMNAKALFQRRSLSSAPDSGSSSMILNFNLPTEKVYSETPVSQVIVPGSAGEYGVTADHVPVVAQLKAGVLQIFHDSSSDPEKYFVPGGFSLTHANSVTVSISKRL